MERDNLKISESGLNVHVMDSNGHIDTQMERILVSQKKLEFAEKLKREKENKIRRDESEAVRLQLEKTLKNIFLSKSIFFLNFSILVETHGLYRTTLLRISMTENLDKNFLSPSEHS